MTVPLPSAMAEGPRVAGPAAAKFGTSAQPPNWAPVITLVLWSGCLVIGGLGFLLPYERPKPPAQAPEPIQAEILQVELTHDPLPVPSLSVPVTPSAPPPAASVPPVPAAPPRVPVVEPNPVIAFAIPEEEPAQPAGIAPSVSAAADSAATSTAAAAEVTATLPVAQTLTYGRGDGRQPAPEYPRQARQAGQQGTVGIRFVVGADGRVTTAEVAEPSPWPLLNNAALQTVRERWRFRPGSSRLYLVSIRFQLQN